MEFAPHDLRIYNPQSLEESQALKKQGDDILAHRLQKTLPSRRADAAAADGSRQMAAALGQVAVHDLASSDDGVIDLGAAAPSPRGGQIDTCIQILRSLGYLVQPAPSQTINLVGGHNRNKRTPHKRKTKKNRIPKLFSEGLFISYYL